MFSCTPTCYGCLNEVWTRGVPVQRSPVPTLYVTSPGKYLPFTTAMSTGDQIDMFLLSVQIKKLFNEGKLPSSEERSLQEVCSSTTWTRLHVKVRHSTLSSSMQKPKKQ